MKTVCLLVLLVIPVSVPIAAHSQQKKKPPLNRSPQLVRTTIRHEVRRFAYGGTLTLIGPPEGSITIEGWPRSEVDISAEIQLRADTEIDLDLLAAVNTFVLDEDMNHLQVLSTGTHDKAFMRSVAKKFPKTLLGLPWQIDYRIRVPFSIDLEINAGRGPVSIVGVEGNVRLSATQSEANLKLSGGTLSATIAIGKLNLTIPVKSWRGVGAELRLAAGEITVAVPAGFSGDIDAEILRVGKIENSFEGLQPRERQGQTAQKIKARVGAGGAFFNLTVGDGTIYIKKQITQ
ncbi:MAG TPA: hypothetical protein VGO73_02040 [Pyrinomonadaceae bacterium]|jgi:hypothetical protein|nr:hypothetical protein [Pyrinomonadaceae bacterium]